MWNLGSPVLDRGSQLRLHLTITRKFQQDAQATWGSESLGVVSCFVLFLTIQGQPGLNTDRSTMTQKSC